MHTDMQMEEELAFLERYQLTPDELLFIRILLASREGTYAKDIVRRYFDLSESVRNNSRTLLKSLQDKQVILKDYKIPGAGEKFSPHSVPFNKNFEKAIFRSAFDMGKELFEHYPLSTIVNGMEYKLRRVSKKYDSLEQAYYNYGKYIRWNQERHEKIIELIEAGKESGYQFSTLDSFIVDNDWINLEALSEKGQLTPTLRML